MREKVSVAMASFNGEKYISTQIKSILENLTENDELIISDDGSTDGTRRIIEEFNDSRIKILDGPKQGVKKNFENAIRNCSGKYIFLSDQDDVWMGNKVDLMLSAFKEKRCLVMVHNCSLINEDGGQILPDFFKYRHSGTGRIKNVMKNTYVGCCMAFDASIKDRILPIPEDIEMHDQWIGLLGEEKGRGYFLNEKLILWRRHEGTASDCFHHYSLKKMFENRKNLLKALRLRKV